MPTYDNVQDALQAMANRLEDMERTTAEAIEDFQAKLHAHNFIIHLTKEAALNSELRSEGKWRELISHCVANVREQANAPVEGPAADLLPRMWSKIADEMERFLHEESARKPDLTVIMGGKETDAE
ncbi:hypothetical protein [Salipiger thiooxidans]|uniref:hypothetical protein n=1 Tax=Salipiger thiooxidans TaxID=282683 RepID=UPI001CD7A037|nr:hypothetical protein [Salipiger thiooxidans]MCA0847188.1 hypothetical protein [Salipiger thiooxidans]